jgi:hypothetical protein
MVYKSPINYSATGCTPPTLRSIGTAQYQYHEHKPYTQRSYSISPPDHCHTMISVSAIPLS